MFPNSMIIHIVRDPLDTAVSCFTSHFATDNWTLTLDALHDIFALYLEIIAHFKRVLPGRLYEVQYDVLFMTLKIKFEVYWTSWGCSGLRV